MSALFDTGSAISLVDSKYMSLIKSGQRRGPSIKLCGANGSPLTNKDTYEMTIKVNNRMILQPVHFIENLQVPCILGMDFMKELGYRSTLEKNVSKWENHLLTTKKCCF